MPSSIIKNKDGDIIKASKDGRYLIFILDDGKIIKYDLSTGTMYGKSGKPVKNLRTHFTTHNIREIIDSFDDKRYQQYLEFVNTKFVNDSRGWGYHGRNPDGTVNRVRNMSTFLAAVGKYSRFEQFFAADVQRVDTNLKYRMSDVPKRLLKMIKQYNWLLSNQLIEAYNRNPNAFVYIITKKYESIERNELYAQLVLNDYIMSLIQQHKYTSKALMRYIDKLATYEALSLSEIARELYDYCNMASAISEKWDKYPRNFLTTHKIMTRNYNRLVKEFPEQVFNSRIDTTYEWSKGKYCIIYPKTTQDIKDEAVFMHHCVASYIQDVIDAKCHILFMRYKDTKDVGLITLQIKGTKIVHARGQFNREVSNEEQVVLDEYVKHLINYARTSNMRASIQAKNNEEVAIC
ncbi:MAG: PcfJ domain-containing protein [Methanogenium sp.]